MSLWEKQAPKWSPVLSGAVMSISVQTSPVGVERSRRKEDFSRGYLGVCVFQRPTAKELLKHKFIIRNAKKTSYLTELIDRYKRWKAEQSHDDSSSEDSDV